MKKIKKLKFLILLPILLSGVLWSFTFFNDDDDFYLTKNLTIFHDIVRDIRLFYVDDVSAGEVVKNSIDKMLANLDPYTIYYPESKIEDYSFMSTGFYGGIGASVVERGGELLITDVYENYPANKGGLLGGDIIISIDGNKVSKGKVTQIKESLKGEPGSTILLSVREGLTGNVVEKTLVREKIDIKNVSFFGMIAPSTGYIKLEGFRPNAAKEVKTAFLKLKTDSGMTNLVLDLRGNPGGLLIEAVRIVNLFVEKGNNVVSMRGKSSQWNKEFRATEKPEDVNMPIAVLVNENSASAAEIVSGALQDLDRAVIIGKRTFGKGLVQVTRDLSYNTKLKITTAKYYIPSGRCIQALDYTHRNNDGTVDHVADSLISEFTTQNNRKVFDGGGISPDIYVNHKSNDFVFSLQNQWFIFDYATLYITGNKNIKNPNQFSISESNYEEFIKFVNNKHFIFNSEDEINLENFISSFTNQEAKDKIQKEIDQIRIKLKTDNNYQLAQNKQQIIALINKEICKRVFLNYGEIVSSFRIDTDIIEAEKVLLNGEIYNSILKN